MKRTPLWQGRIARVIVILIALGFAAQNFAQDLPLNVEKAGDKLVIKIKPSDKLRASLLNHGPAYKALVKVSGIDNQVKPGRLSNLRLPENNILKQIQLTPMGKGIGLLTVEFSRKIDFKWYNDHDYRMVINLPKPLPSWEKHYRAGLEYHKKGLLEQALSEYRKAVFQNRKHGNAYYKAGQIRAAFGQYRLAEINYNHALRLKCDSLGLYKSMAQLYSKIGNPAKAAQFRQLFAEKQKKETSEKNSIALVEKNSEPQKTVTTPTFSSPTQDSLQAMPLNGDSTATARVIPAKTKWQFAGIAVIMLGFVALGIRSIRSRRKKVIEWVPPTKMSEEEIERRKQRILDMARETQAKQGPIETEPEIKPALNDSKNDVKVDSAGENSKVETKVLLENGMSRTAGKDVDLFSDEPIPHWKRYELAKSLNLGIGEIELALNLKSHQRQAGKSITFDQSVMQKLNENKSVSEIAKEMGVGKGEVELLLAIQNSTKNSI